MCIRDSSTEQIPPTVNDLIFLHGCEGVMWEMGKWGKGMLPGPEYDEII